MRPETEGLSHGLKTCHHSAALTGLVYIFARSSFLILFQFHSTSFRMRPETEGLSHGLKTVHRTVFTLAAPRPAFRVHQRYQKTDTPMGYPFFGAADGTRTRTVSLPGDFKSPVSTDSTTAAAKGHFSTILNCRQVTAGPDSGQMHPGSNPGTSPVPASAMPSWHPRSAWPQNRTPCCRPSAPPHT